MKGVQLLAGGARGEGLKTAVMNVSLYELMKMVAE